jgi:hypothetical protein
MRWKTEQSLLGRILGRSGASTTAVELDKPPFQRVPGYLPWKDEKRGSETDHFPQSAAGVKIDWTYITALLIHLHSVLQAENCTASPNPPCQNAI